jgi:NADH-quinone oxidoreductase subunit A
VTTGFVPIVIYAIVIGGFAILSLLLPRLVAPRKPSPAKAAPYECGITPTRLPEAERFPVKFYVIAMLFIIFDIETIFLYPWAVAFRRLGLFGLGEMVVFIGLVFVAYVFVWQKGGLEWEQPSRPIEAGSVPLPIDLPPEPVIPPPGATTGPVAAGRP